MDTKTFINGGISGGIALTLVYPLEYLKTIKQLPKNYHQKNIFGLVKNDIKQNGIKSIFRGYLPQLLSSIPRTSIRFISFNYANKVLNNENKKSHLKNFGAGLFAGTMESITVYTPSEVLKVQNINHPKKNLTQIIKYIYQTNGIYGFYNGLFPTILRQGTTQGLSFLGNNFSRKYYSKYFGDTSSSFLSGVTGGIFATVINNPLDVIKTNQQSFDKKSKDTIMETVKQIYRSNGIKGFYKGLIFRSLRVGPLHGITFMMLSFLNKN